MTTELIAHEGSASYVVAQSAIAKGYKQTEVGVIPADWVCESLENMSAFITKGSTPTTYGYKWEQSGILFLRSECVSEVGLDLAQSMFISAAAHASLRRSEVCDGDILVTITGNVGRTVYLQNIGYANLNQHIARVRITSTQVERRYVYHYLSQASVRRYFNTITTGQAYPQISLRQVRETVIPLPPTKAEQEAIAEALSDADALIERLAQLVAKKRQLKLGAMQELLTGKKRLPGFGGECKSMPLGDIAEIKKGQLITEKDAVPGSIPVIAGGKKPAYFHNQSNRFGKTITVSASGASAGYVAFFEEPIFASDCSTIGEGKNYSVEFIYFQLQLNQEAIYKAQTGGAQPHIHAVDLMPLEISCPDLEEQTAIATILSDMDAEIAALEQQLAKARGIKQGMMQELLTGKIRLV